MLKDGLVLIWELGVNLELTLMNNDRTREERILRTIHWPFEGQADMHRYIHPDGLSSRG